MIELSFVITAFATLFVVIDPIGLAPIYMSLTAGLDAQAKRQIAIRACLVAIAVLVVFALFGEAVLGFVGISMGAFRIAGGILLFVTAFDMLFERRSARRENRADEEEFDDPSVFPLAIPLLAGPGAIASMILLTGEHPGVQGFAVVTGVMISVVALAFALFMLSGRIERMLGKSGIHVMTRIFGMLLAALSVQFVLDGLRSSGLFGSL
ncbi:MAG: MarC family protein [Marinibacterium sp.]|nr:MarC family protein [Marinibacterium sp.]